MSEHTLIPLVFRYAQAFRESQIVLAAVELHIFESLSTHPATSAQLAKELECDPRGLATLLDALAGFEVLEKSDERYAIPAELAHALSPDHAETILPMLRHQMMLEKTWGHLAEVVKSGRPVARRGSPRFRLTEGLHRSHARAR